MDENVMKKKFDDIISSIISQKRDDNKAFLSSSEYDCRLEQLKSSKLALNTNGMKKTIKDYRMVPKSIKEKELTLREAAGLNSISGTQGYQRCHCKTKCKNNKCACSSSGKLCNSKCHGSLICENK